MVAKIKLTGDKELIKQLRELSGGGQRRAVKSATSYSLGPLVSQSRKNIPVETGIMRKSLGRKVKSYPSKGVVFGLVGINRGSKDPATGRNPAKYLHLIELGVKRHVIRPKNKKALAFNGRFSKRVNHPGFTAKAPLQRAFDAGKGEALARFNKKLGQRIVVEAKKAAAKKAAKGK